MTFQKFRFYYQPTSSANEITKSTYVLFKICPGVVEYPFTFQILLKTPPPGCLGQLLNLDYHVYSVGGNNLCTYFYFCQFLPMLPKMEKEKLFTIIYADILIFANANVA